MTAFQDVTSFWICSVLWIGCKQMTSLQRGTGFQKTTSKTPLLLLPQVFYTELDFLSFPNSAISQVIYMPTGPQTATSNMSGKMTWTLVQLHMHINRAWLAVKLTGPTSKGAQEERPRSASQREAIVVRGRGCCPRCGAPLTRPLGGRLTEEPRPVRGPGSL